MNEEIKLERGQVIYLKFNDAVGSEEAVGRPGVVISSEQGIGTSPVVTVAYLTTAPKKIGIAVELFTPHKKCWAMCNQIATVDKSRIMGYMCKLSESEMLKIDLALRKALALPIKVEDSTDKILALESKIDGLNKTIEEQGFELEIQKNLYSKVLDKYVEARFHNDIHEREKKMFGDDEPPMEPIIVEPDPVVVEPKPVIPQKEIDRIMENTNLSCAGIGKAKLKPGAKKVNINRCSVADLVNLGMGENTARMIVSRRKTKGQYSSKDELLKLSRFGNGCMTVFGDYLEV